ncbi:hypothetical protein FAIPA1_670003 [Frankia sp. AiPs1]
MCAVAARGIGCTEPVRPVSSGLVRLLAGRGGTGSMCQVTRSGAVRDPAADPGLPVEQAAQVRTAFLPHPAHLPQLPGRRS